jgi:peptidyl-tRNA hydrolase, PTH2 family
MSEIKQVIVMRKTFPDGKGGTMKPRKGKMIAQGSHASMMWLSLRIQEALKSRMKDPPHMVELRDFLVLSDCELAWLEGNFAKVVVGVETETELLNIYDVALANGLEVNLVVDSGLTEFGGVPTPTAVAIGPDYSEKIDPITGELQLL